MTTKRKCKHDVWLFEACEQCHEEEVQALKAQLERRCACEFEGNDVPRVQVRWCSLHEEMRKRLAAREKELFDVLCRVRGEGE